MAPATLVVGWASLQSALVHLPGPWVRLLLDRPQAGAAPVTVKLQWGGNHVAYVSWGGGVSSAPPAATGEDAPMRIEMEPRLGQALGLREGQTVRSALAVRYCSRAADREALTSEGSGGALRRRQVSAELVTRLPLAEQVHVEPLTPDDWEIMVRPGACPGGNVHESAHDATVSSSSCHGGRNVLPARWRPS